MGRVKSELAWDAIEAEKARKGNFYSESLKDEVKRLRAELSNERALCAGLGIVLRPFADLADWIAENKPDWDTDAHEVQVENWPYTLSVGWLRDARVALSELEKSK